MGVFYCEPCGREVPCSDNVDESIADAVAHMQVWHPDAFDQLDRWPDGAPVVHDLTLEPADFE